MKNNQNQQLTLEQESSLITRLNDLKRDLSLKKGSDIGGLALLNQELFALKVGKSSFDELPESQKKIRLEQIDLKKAEIAQLEAAIQQLENKISSITQQLENANRDVSLDVLLEHQAGVEAIEAEIDKHYTLVEKQRLIIKEAGVKVDDVSPLLTEREGILVKIALGDDTQQSDLGKLNKKIEQARLSDQKAAKEKQSIIEQAQQAITGLERIIENLKSELKPLEKLTAFIVDKYLIAKAEQAKAEYLKKAAELKQAAETIRAVDYLVRPISKRISGLLPNNYDAMRGSLGNHDIESLNIAQQIKSDLAGHGVIIPQWG